MLSLHQAVKIQYRYNNNTTQHNNLRPYCNCFISIILVTQASLNSNVEKLKVELFI